MENFFNLRAEKQEHIISAAMSVFGKNGYKKASVAEIAEQAGIAKGMINYYFGSKRNLYVSLIQISGRIMLEEMQERYDSSITDFFDNLKMMIGIKIDVMKEHPALLSFLTSVGFETHEDVADEIKKFLVESFSTREKMIYGGTDVSRFKEDVDPKLIDKFLVWAAEGFMKSIEDEPDMKKIDEFTAELFKCLDLMKKYFYNTVDAC